MDTDITSGAFQRLIGVGKVALNDLANRGVVIRGSKRGTYALEPSVAGYCAHLREQAAGRNGEAGADARARLGAAHMDIRRARRSEAASWPSLIGCATSRTSSAQMLTAELRSALTELADGAV